MWDKHGRVAIVDVGWEKEGSPDTAPNIRIVAGQVMMCSL
jgi:hypothetical protein